MYYNNQANHNKVGRRSEMTKSGRDMKDFVSVKGGNIGLPADLVSVFNKVNFSS